MAKVERLITVYAGGKQGRDAPQQSAGNYQWFTLEAVAKPAGHWRRYHVGDEEGIGQGAHSLVADAEFLLHQRLHTRQNIAIDKIEEFFINII